VSSSFDLLAASLRADASDVRTFVEALGVKLSESFPSKVTVERKGGRFRGAQRVRRIAVGLGDSEYELVNDDGAVSCARRVVVRGIALKTEQLSLEQWIDALASQLVDEAGKSESDRLALERMLAE
jgi:hypothetical protein